MVKDKQALKQDFSDNSLVTGDKFGDLIDSLKSVQAVISDPSASGTSVTFIATITQDSEGKITATKKTVDFSGCMPWFDLSPYQYDDVQVVENIEVSGDGSDIAVTVEHKKDHFPTVRVINGDGYEVRPKSRMESPYSVQHVDQGTLIITIDGALNVEGETYKYILD